MLKYNSIKINESQANLSVVIRSAKLEDAKFLLEIHNTSVKGGFFNSKNLVVYDEHIEWFKNKLKSNSKIYIGENVNKKFGFVRFDEVKNNIFEISIGNLANFYGKGLGSLMLEQSIQKFIKNYKPKKIICVVKNFNVRSSKCFIKNGFKKIEFEETNHFTINVFNSNLDNYYELG